MASGIINGTTSNEYIDVKIEWSNSTNIEKNQSSLTMALWFRRNNTGYTTYGTLNYKITIDSSNIVLQGAKSVTIGEEWVKVASTTTTVAHDDEGDRSVKISATGSMPGTTLTSFTCSGTAKLNTIPRKSEILSVSKGTLGKNCSIKWRPSSSTFRYKLVFQPSGKSSVTSEIIHPNKKTDYTYTGFTFPLDWANYVPNDTTIKVYVTLYTYRDSGASEAVGMSTTQTFTVTVPNDSNTKPSVSATLTPSHSLAEDFDGLYIQGKSKVKATITAEGEYGATITSKTMVVEGQTYDSGDSFTSEYLTGYGSIAVKITAIDSRGYSQTITKYINVLAYTKPKVVSASGESAIICARCDKDGNLDESGAYLKIKARRSYSLCKSDGVQKNFCGLRYRYKTVAASAYSNWITLLGAKTLTTEEVDTIQMNGNLATTSSYIVHVDAVDLVGHHEYIVFEIPTDKVYMHRSGSKNSLGLGKYAERNNALDTDWDIYTNGHRVTGLPTPTGDTDAVPKSYVDPADVKINKSLNATGWYKVGTLSGEMCAVATVTTGGKFVYNQASPSMVDIATQYNQARVFLRLPSLTDNQISKIGVVKESTRVYGVYAYYNSSDENPVSINIHTHMGSFVSAELVASDVSESDMFAVVTLKA